MLISTGKRKKNLEKSTLGDVIRDLGEEIRARSRSLFIFIEIFSRKQKIQEKQ